MREKIEFCFTQIIGLVLIIAIPLSLILIIGLSIFSQKAQADVYCEVEDFKKIADMPLIQDGVYSFYDREKSKEYLLFYCTDSWGNTMQVIER